MTDRDSTRDSVVIYYEFNLPGSCGCIQPIHVDPDTYEPPDGVYRCPDCGCEERVP